MFDALVKAQAISTANSESPKKVHWVRTARTDKGVHAAGNVVSLKMQFPYSDEIMLTKINEHLPEQIRVWGITDVMRSFHAKTNCDSRVYEYLLPSYAFSAPIAKILRDEPTSDSDMKIMSNDGSIVKYVSRTTDAEIKEKEAYRISDSQLDSFKEALDMYKGTHNFHNYTVGRQYTDASNKRYIMDITVSQETGRRHLIMIRDTKVWSCLYRLANPSTLTMSNGLVSNFMVNHSCSIKFERWSVSKNFAQMID